MRLVVLDELCQLFFHSERMMPCTLSEGKLNKNNIWNCSDN